jgi:hypothetical protein
VGVPAAHKHAKDGNEGGEKEWRPDKKRELLYNQSLNFRIGSQGQQRARLHKKVQRARYQHEQKEVAGALVLVDRTRDEILEGHKFNPNPHEKREVDADEADQVWVGYVKIGIQAGRRERNPFGSENNIVDQPRNGGYDSHVLENYRFKISLRVVGMLLRDAAAKPLGALACKEEVISSGERRSQQRHDNNDDTTYNVLDYIDGTGSESLLFQLAVKDPTQARIEEKGEHHGTQDGANGNFPAIVFSSPFSSISQALLALALLPLQGRTNHIRC